MMSMRRFVSFTQRLRLLKSDALALYYAVRHAGTPWYAKALTLLLGVYVVSPIDLVPDLVPLLGFVDDLIVIPLGLSVVLRLVPAAVMRECRTRAGHTMQKPVNWLLNFLMLLMWIALGLLIGLFLYRYLNP